MGTGKREDFWMPAVKWLVGRCLCEMSPGALEDGNEEGWWKPSPYPSLWLGRRPRHSFPPTNDSGKSFGHSCKEQHRMGGPARGWEPRSPGCLLGTGGATMRWKEEGKSRSERGVARWAGERLHCTRQEGWWLGPGRRVGIPSGRPEEVPKAAVGQVEATGSHELRTAGLVTSGEE